MDTKFRALIGDCFEPGPLRELVESVGYALTQLCLRDGQLAQDQIDSLANHYLAARNAIWAIDDVATAAEFAKLDAILNPKPLAAG